MNKNENLWHDIYGNGDLEQQGGDRRPDYMSENDIIRRIMITGIAVAPIQGPAPLQIQGFLAV